jgi:uncharacterized protein YgfB (UPF0149 family)
MARVSDQQLIEMIHEMSKQTGLKLTAYFAYGDVRINMILPSGGEKTFSETFSRNGELATWINAFMQGWHARDEFIRKGTLHWRPEA